MSTIFHSCQPKQEFHFDNAESAVSKYQFFSSELQTTETNNIKELADNICRWQQLSDTLLLHVCNSSEANRDTSLALTFCSVSDTIRTNLLRLAESDERSYQDILTVKFRTCHYRKDTVWVQMKTAARGYFQQLDSIKLQSTTLSQALSSYRIFLSETQQDGIHDRGDFLRFIREEDMHFRAFLCHLSECGDIPLDDITKDTEKVCGMVFDAADIGELDNEEVITLMAMRTNRRMLQNAQVCINALLSNDIKDENQLAAYQWMSMQPFIAINGVSLALLTEDEQAQLSHIAESISLLTRDPNRKNALGLLSSRELPHQILKLYISSL